MLRTSEGGHLLHMGEVADVEIGAVISGYGMMAGRSGSCYATLIIRLKNWDDRPGMNHNIMLVYGRFAFDCKEIKNAKCYPPCKRVKSVDICYLTNFFCTFATNLGNMRTFNINWLLVFSVLVLLSSCDKDEIKVKRRGERQIYVLTSEGHIYDLMGDRIMELPDCEYASEIISDGDDYFVSGKSTKDKVGYWKNGKWNTLHIDFIDNVSHETQGIAKWDYYIYLFDYPYILKNSGIFPIEDCEDFNTSGQCIAVSNGKCYLAGMEYHHGEPNDAVLYYESKGRYAKAILPKPSPDVSGHATNIYAYDTDHTIVGGHVGTEPCIWVDKELQVLPRTLNPQPYEYDLPLGHVSSTTYLNGHIYACGYEDDEDHNMRAVLWVDGVPQQIHSGRQEKVLFSFAEELMAYGDDLYMLSFECYEYKLPNGETDTSLDIFIWMNDRIIAKYDHIDIVNFTVV